MDTASIIAELEQQRSRIDQAINALNGASRGPRRKTGRRQMSPEARRRISLAQKRRWAKQKRAR